MGLSLIKCPECEGNKKAVNHFDIPDKNNNRKFTRIEEHKMKRSDGREFLDYECQVCDGKGFVYG